MLAGRVRELAIISIFNPDYTTDDLIEKVIEATVDECRKVDQLRSRSFGLSMGHRMKTRLVDLLLILVRSRPSTVHKENVISLCIDTIMDGSQQYSIRLPIEWIVTLFCLNDVNFFNEWLTKDVTVS